MLSQGGIGVMHVGQIDPRGLSIVRQRRGSRQMQTFRNDPAQAPKRIGLNLSRDHSRRSATYDWALLTPPFGPIAASLYGIPNEVLEALHKQAWVPNQKRQGRIIAAFKTKKPYFGDKSGIPATADLLEGFIF